MALVMLAALFVAVGGYVHLREWLDFYRHVPAAVPGSVVVRVGFPANAAVSVVLAAAMVGTMFVARRAAGCVLAAASVFQVGSLVALVVSHYGSLVGWMDPAWTLGAKQSLATEVGALVTVAAIAAVGLASRSFAAARHPGV